jgi:hypothetical protein
MWFKLVASVGFLVVLIGLVFWSVRKVDQHFDDYNAKSARVVQLEQSLATSQGEVRTLQEQRRIDAEQALGDYQKADWACNSTIKEVVAGNKVKPIILKERIYETTGECPAPEPMYRVRSLQRAGRSADSDDESPLPSGPVE